MLVALFRFVLFCYVSLVCFALFKFALALLVGVGLFCVGSLIAGLRRFLETHARFFVDVPLSFVALLL